MVTIGLVTLFKAISKVDSLGKSKEAMSIKEELVCLKSKAINAEDYDYVEMSEELAKRLLNILNKNHINLEELVTNEFLLTSGFISVI
ncbi:MAG: hypothetical protein IJ809_02860 [Clostridia bacterium]|nr:hypothetical protein [Clostridia bacterium]